MAIVQAGLSPRAPPDGGGICAVPDCRPSGRAARTLADAAGQGRARTQARHDAVGGNWSRPVYCGHVDSPHDRHASPAPVPGQSHYRARIARCAVAGVHRDDCAPGTPGVSRPAFHASEPGVRAGPHVHVAVLHHRLDSAAGRHDGPAGLYSPCAFTAHRFRRSNGFDFHLASGSGARCPGARRANEPSGATLVHHRDDSTAGQGSARHGNRRAAGGRAPSSVGTLVWANGSRPLGFRVVARPGMGSVRTGLRGRRGLRVVVPSFSRKRRTPGVGRGRAPLRIHRSDGRRDWIPARILDGRFAAPRLAGGLRGFHRGCGRSDSPFCVAQRHPSGPRFIRLPRYVPGRPRRCFTYPSRRRGSCRCWRERRR